MGITRVYDSTVEAGASAFPRLDLSDAVGARAVLKALGETALEDGIERATDDRVEEIERTIPGTDGSPDIPIRIYMPKNRKNSGPGFVNFHGGAFILGDLESEHNRCLVMAAQGGAVSVGIDYRLAPENPFPAGVEDCYAGLKWVAENAAELKIDPSRIAIGGGSAGGNLSAAVAMMARDRGGPDVAFQMLFFPVLDNLCQTPSMKNGTDLYIFDYPSAIDMWNQYIGEDRNNVSPYASPARAEDLSALPPAYVITAEHDPLRDEGITYAMRLMQAGIPVELHCYPGTVHSFDFLTPSDISTRAVNEAVVAFKQAMAD
jgi:acetyl esterase